MIRLAFIGLGTSAAYQLKALEGSDTYKVVAGCDTNQKRKDRLPPGSHFSDSAYSMIKSVRPDAVVVSVPTREHVDVATMVLELGCNVLLEKPAVMFEPELSQLYASITGDAILHVAYHAAFAQDLLWYIQEVKQMNGPLRSFYCGFSDPYITNGKLVDGAACLEGSWLDSGINALSVVSTLVDVRSLEAIGITRVTLPQHAKTEIQAGVNFRFKNENGEIGTGQIDTNWAMDLNYKHTILHYERQSVLLDHSRQCVCTRVVDGEWQTIADFSSGGERLVQQYRGVFEDFEVAISKNQSNEALTRHLHSLLFAPYDFVLGSNG